MGFTNSSTNERSLSIIARRSASCTPRSHIISAECRESQNVERWRTVGEAAGEGGGGGDDGKDSAVCILPGDVLPGEASDLSGENLFAARWTAD